MPHLLSFHFSSTQAVRAARVLATPSLMFRFTTQPLVSVYPYVPAFLSKPTPLAHMTHCKIWHCCTVVSFVQRKPCDRPFPPSTKRLSPPFYFLSLPAGSWQTSFDENSDVPPVPTPRSSLGKAAFMHREFYVMGGEYFPGEHPDAEDSVSLR